MCLLGLAASAAWGGALAEFHNGGLNGAQAANLVRLQTRLLRSMLEWGKDLSSPQEAGVSPTTSTTSTANTSSSSTTTANLAIPALASYSQAARAPAAAGPSTALPDTVKPPKDVMVLVWPGGRIEQFPRGTTAGNVIQRLGYIEIQGSFPAPRTEGAGPPACHLGFGGAGRRVSSALGPLAQYLNAPCSCD